MEVEIKSSSVCTRCMLYSIIPESNPRCKNKKQNDSRIQILYRNSRSFLLPTRTRSPAPSIRCT